MKKFKFVLLAAAGCFVLACDDDRDTGNRDITGTYDLTAFNTPIPVDYDGDGISSTNMVDETSCYNDSRITINRDGTYILEEGSVRIQGTTSFCDLRITKGTWTRSGNALTTTSDLADDIVVTNYAFTTENGISKNTMTSISNANYPGRNASGNPQSSFGTVDVIYTRHTDSTN